VKSKIVFATCWTLIPPILICKVISEIVGASPHGGSAKMNERQNSKGDNTGYITKMEVQDVVS
jgi:hypothetical protein